MKNTLIQQVGQKMQTAKETFLNLIKQCKPNEIQQGQLDFNEILHDQHKQNGKDQQHTDKIQSSLSQKIEQALRNSNIAKTIYHKEQPQKLAQKCAESSQVIKQLQNEVSLNDVSKILILKIQQTYPELEEQTRGILYKYSPSLFGGWSERYCILTPKNFIYLENKNEFSSMAGILNFNILAFSAQLKFINNKVDSFEIKVVNGDKSFIFKGQNSSQTKKWFQKISKYIESSQGKMNNATSLSNYHRFWRKDYITEKQFTKIVKTGDIMLFRGKKTSALLQRTMTGQQFDHIGVILLNAFGQILIFQANGGFGVGICPWKKFIKHKWYQDQQIVALRQLKIIRNEKFLNEVSNFVEENIGKQYKFSLKNYIMSRHSSVDNENTSYFCSSLVAKLYKKLGLLPPNISSSRYMPYDFSQKEKLELLNGKYGQTQLGRQKIIVFENKLFQKGV